MEIRRVILYAALALVVYTLWMDWQKDFNPPQQANQQISQSNSNKTISKEEHLLPAFNSSSGKTDKLLPGIENNVNKTSPQGGNESNNKVINIKTDVLDLDIDLKQGSIIKAELLKYPVSIDKKDKPFTLLNNAPLNRYVADSNLFSVEGQNINTLDFNFTSDKTHYELAENADKLIVTLKGSTPEGLIVNKQFILNKSNYLIEMRYLISNQGSSPWKGHMNTRFLQSTPSEDKSSIFHVGSYTGASYSNPQGSHFKKVSYKDMSKHNLDTEIKDGWIAMQQHYFLTSWIPEENSTNQFYTRTFDGDYTIGMVSQPLVVAPFQTKEIGSRLYLGPEIGSDLKAIAPHLDLTIDYGWLWFLSSLLFSVMKVIYSVVGNWGWVIVLVTVLIKLAFYRLSATSYKSMAGMRNLQPKLQALRERYGDDKAKISQATMELYRQEKVNPLGGCLPIIIQIPVFIALYWVLLESVELRQAPFILWIHDLASPDPYHILPILMGGTMLIQQQLNPAPPDPMQAKIMMFLPILFTALFWNFPSGLVLYWIVNNTLSILQQWYITRKFSDTNNKTGKKINKKSTNKKLASVK